MDKPKIEWSFRAKIDIENIYFDLRKRNSAATTQKIIGEITVATKTIIFPEQYQYDDYVINCRRIIIGHYKILYRLERDIIFIVSVFDSRKNPLKMLS